MAHLLLLGSQVALKAVLRLHFGGNPLRHRDSCRLESRHLLRVIRHQAHRLHSEQLQCLGREFIGAAIRGETQFDVGFNGIQALVLQFVRLQLGHEADAAALLLLIKQNSGAFLCDGAQRQFKLQAAVAAQRSEYITCQALRVNPHQRRSCVDISHDQRNQTLNPRSHLLAVFAAGPCRRQYSLEAQDAERSPAGGEIRLGDFLHTFKCHISILLCADLTACVVRHSASACILAGWAVVHWMPRQPARYIDCVADNKLILITLLVNLGVAAAVASALARSRTFQRLLFAERRTRYQTMSLLAFFLVPLTLGVWLRFIVPNFQAADISFETVILLGLLLGPGWAMLSGIVLSGPAVYHHEFLALPFNAALGIAAGILGRFVEKEEIWGFTPFIDLSLYRWVRRNVRHLRFDRQFLMLLVIVAFEIVRESLARMYPGRLFALVTDSWGLRVLVWLGAPVVVGIALKVWNALRIELKLEEQKHLLLEARLDALQRQINPHFLFNTLNSIASLVRSKPEMARQMTVKLANILRALLKDHDTYVPLSHELSFTDDYLDIEVVRFGLTSCGSKKTLIPGPSASSSPAFFFSRSSKTASSTGLNRASMAAR